jgi:hypothetical protein
VSTHHPASRARHLRCRARGVAIMIVMVVVALATVLGFAMVSASSLQSQTAGNLRYTSVAEYLAESGGQLALYYLQYPSASPVAIPSGYYPGQTGLTFGTAVKGTADVTVTYNSTTKLYTITSVGKATTDGGGTISKTLTATASVVKNFKQTTAVSTSSDVRLPGLCTVVGALETNAQLNAATGSAVTGLAKYRTFTGLGSVPNRQALTASETVTVPSLASIRSYAGSYTYNGQTYNAQYLTATTLSNQTLPTASDAVTNPAGIYWTDHNVQFSGGVTLNGTLVITNGKLTIANLIALANTVTPKTGFPALVIQSDLEVTAVSASLTCNGLVWTGGGLKTGALLSIVNINGAFIAAGAVPITTTYPGTISISYDASKVAIPDFSSTNTVTVGVRVVTWSMS